MKKKNPAAGAPISIRLADDLKADLDEAGRKLKMDTHQVMRLAMQLGLQHFMRIDYNLAKSLIDSSIAAQTSGATKNPLNQHSEAQIALVAESSGSNIVPLPPRQDVSYDSGRRKKKDPPEKNGTED